MYCALKKRFYIFPLYTICFFWHNDSACQLYHSDGKVQIFLWKGKPISNSAFSWSLDSIKKKFRELFCDFDLFWFWPWVWVTSKKKDLIYQYTKMIFSVQDRMCSTKVVLYMFCVFLVSHKPFVTTFFLKRPELLFSYKYKILDHLFSDNSGHSYGHSYGGTSQTKVSIYCYGYMLTFGY